MHFSQRMKIKKPIFDDYYPQTIEKSQLSHMTQSMSPMVKSQSNYFTNSLQSTLSPMTQSRSKEKIFQRQKVPITINKSSLIDLKPKSQITFQKTEEIFSDIRVSEFEKPIHFQTDQLIQRPVQTETTPIFQEPKYQPKLEDKNDNYLKIATGIIIILLIIIGVIKYK